MLISKCKVNCIIQTLPHEKPGCFGTISITGSCGFLWPELRIEPLEIRLDPPVLPGTDLVIRMADEQESLKWKTACCWPNTMRFSVILQKVIAFQCVVSPWEWNMVTESEKEMLY